MNQMISRMIELEALEIQIVDEYLEPLDVEFSWDIVSFSSNDIQLKFVFSDSSKPSSPSGGLTTIISPLDSPNILITFWATYFFQDEQGNEVPFGS